MVFFNLKGHFQGTVVTLQTQLISQVWDEDLQEKQMIHSSGSLVFLSFAGGGGGGLEVRRFAWAGGGGVSKELEKLRRCVWGLSEAFINESRCMALWTCLVADGDGGDGVLDSLDGYQSPPLNCWERGAAECGSTAENKGKYSRNIRRMGEIKGDDVDLQQ